MNTFVAYRLPETETPLFLNSPCGSMNNATFAIFPFNENAEYQPCFFQGKAVTFSKDLIDITSLPLSILDEPYLASSNKYEQDFEQYQEAFKNNKLDKAILSRIIPHYFPQKKLYQLFDLLVKERPHAFVYWYYHPNHGHWMGATPEVLIKQDNNHYETVSLAGTSYNGNEWTPKELAEQEMVTSYITNALKDYNILEYDKIGPVTITAGPVKHLKTTFVWQQNCDALKMAADFHPTPAVCGLPKDKALSLIQAIEKHQRGYYTGYLGPISKGQPHFFVNLRCMQQIGDKAYLYVGGGITKDSLVLNEWQETEHKAKSLLGFMENL